MTDRSTRRRNWKRTAIVSIAISLAVSQTVAADTIRPNADTGASGAGSDSTEVYYELEYEQGRPVVIEQADTDAAEQAAVAAAAEEAQGWPDFDSTRIVRQGDVDLAERAAYQRAQLWPNFDSTNIAVQPSNPVAAAAEEARGWPNFDSTRIVVQQPSEIISAEVSPVQEHRQAVLDEAPTALTRNGVYAIVDEQGNAVVPELVEATSADSVAASGSGAYVIVDEQGHAVVPELAEFNSVAQAASPSDEERLMVCPPCATQV